MCRVHIFRSSNWVLNVINKSTLNGKNFNAILLFDLKETFNIKLKTNGAKWVHANLSAKIVLCLFWFEILHSFICDLFRMKFLIFHRSVLIGFLFYFSRVEVTRRAIICEEHLGLWLQCLQMTYRRCNHVLSRTLQNETNDLNERCVWITGDQNSIDDYFFGFRSHTGPFPFWRLGWRVDFMCACGFLNPTRSLIIHAKLKLCTERPEYWMLMVGRYSVEPFR